jgi:hypothetical protein
MPKHFFFDLDKTLAKSRSPMDPANQEIFERLCARVDVVVVSGGSLAQIKEQVTSRFDGKYFLLPQSGNQAIDLSGIELWNDLLSEEQVLVINNFVALLRKHFNLTVRDESDIVENRGAQISYSVIGFHEDIEKKYAFDPDDRKRQAALAAFPAEVAALRSIGVDVTPAGTTVFNFIPLGKHKGFNIERLLQREHWNKEDCVYVGDALFPGGNDETVIGVIPTHAVKNPEETFSFISNMLS